MRRTSTAQRGQTIMEVMIAVFIMSIALAAILTLVTYTVYGQQVSEQQIVAQQLAREGIEVARNLRDSDWLAGIATTNTLKTTAREFVAARFTASPPSWVLNELGVCTDWPLCPLWITPAGVYAHDSTGALATPFYRYLTHDLICYNLTSGVLTLATGEGATCGAGTQRIGTRVTSEVRWTSGNAAKSVRLYDYLYDWK